jgi:hypothetical protein
MQKYKIFLITDGCMILRLQQLSQSYVHNCDITEGLHSIYFLHLPHLKFH